MAGPHSADPYWNHNVHHHPAVLAAVPGGCGAALDVGCGDGLLTRKLAARAASVTGVDGPRRHEAANRTALDWLISACGVPASLLHARRHGGKRGPVGMPMEDVHMSWSQIRRALRRLLPGCDVRRTLLWRYVVLWDRPREGGPRVASEAAFPAPPHGD